MDFTEKEAAGCLALSLFALIAVASSVAVGLFFGAGFGFAVLAGFAAFALAFTLRVFMKAGK